MITHVVCLDGTGQRRPQRYPTNIALIFDAMNGDIVDGGGESWEKARTQAGTLTQTGKYLAGVGTRGSPILQILGQGLGDGIAEKIVRGYTYLSRNYRPDDNIILAGFSRGAAAARALAGLITHQGLLNSTQYDPSHKE